MVLNKVNRAFVTGGSGKIGKHLVSLLLRENFDIKILSRNDLTSWQNQNRVKVVKADLLDKNILTKELSEDDYVFHLAVHQGVDRFDWETFFKVNVLGTEVLLESCLKKKVKKVICVSSIVVFESTGQNEQDEKMHLIDAKRSDHYAASKVEALKRTRNFVAKTKGLLPIITVFPSMVIDLNDFNSSRPTNKSFLQSFFWDKIGGGIPGGVINRIGRGNRILNYVIIEDLVQGLLLAAYNGNSGEEYILGGENITAQGYLKALTDRTKKKVLPLRVPVFPFRVIYLFRNILKLPPVISIIVQNITKDYFLSSKKAKKKLGYNPERKL